MRILLLSLLALLPSSVQSIPVVDPSSPWFEEYRERVPASGSPWVGFTVAQRVESVDATQAFVRLPGGEGGVLCVEINSRDGRYLGVFRYPVPQVRPVALKMRVPTQYRRELAAYSGRDLVVSALLAQSCPSSEGVHLAVSWASPATYDSVTVSINSTSPAYVAWRSKGQDHRVNCQRRVGSRSAAFNQSCMLSRASLGDSAQVVVRRCRLGSCAHDIWKTVKLP